VSVLPKLDIALVGPESAERMADLHASWWRDSDWVERPWRAAAWHSVLRMPGCIGLIADRTGRPAGLAAVRMAADEAELLMIAVAPAARRQGVGLSLLSAVIAWAGAAGARRLILEVAEPNAPARALYAGAGFHVVGRRPDYYEFANCFASAVIMARQLPD
jgi:ribosomal-protein-alanine N-acetyltransferase